MRDIALNVQYLGLVENVANARQIDKLAGQMSLPHLTDAYKWVTSESYQAPITDLRPKKKTTEGWNLAYYSMI